MLQFTCTDKLTQYATQYNAYAYCRYIVAPHNAQTEATTANALQQKLRSQLPCNLLNVVTVGTLTSGTPQNQINQFNKQNSFIGSVATKGLLRCSNVG